MNYLEGRCIFFYLNRILSQMFILTAIIKNLAGDWIFAATSSSLVSINYEGTMDEWNLINKDGRWKDNSNITKIICSDGTIEL